MKNFNRFIEQSLLKYSSLNDGNLASYIPELAFANPKDFAIAIVDCDGNKYVGGNSESEFTLQSTSKPFSYGLLLSQIGPEALLKIVGVEPTGEAFNSIIELEKKTHRPYNPMINSGAIAVCAHLQAPTPEERFQKVLSHFEQYTNRKLDYNKDVFYSEKKTAHRNRAIGHLLRHFEIIGDDIEESLDLYFKQCSIKCNVIDLATMAATLASHGVNPVSKSKVVDENVARDVLSLIFTCGMYDTSGEWAFQVGLPAKSGVSGAILTVIPGQLGIAVYSPLINSHGHSVRGLEVIKDFAREFQFNLFQG